MTLRQKVGGPSRAPLLGVATVTALLLFVVPAGLATAESGPANGAAVAGSWDYGALKTVSFAGIGADGVHYKGNATYGFTVELQQFNSTTEANAFELVMQRTLGASFNVEYCIPTCKDPTTDRQVSARIWAQENSSSNLIDNGSVYENGVMVPAYALLNSSTVLVANETDRASSGTAAAAGPGTVQRWGYLSAQVNSELAVDFATPLGLFPLDLSGDQTWNSSAEFSAAANVAYSYFAAYNGPLVQGSWRGSGAFPVQGSGLVNLSGTNSPSATVQLGASTYSQVSVSTEGPFGLDEGVFLAPLAGDLFAGSSEPWSGNETGAATASLAALDLRGTSAGHLGLGASRWVFDSSTIDPTDSMFSNGAAPRLVGASSSDSAPSTVVQGEPESPAQSAATTSCLELGLGCGSATGLRGLLGFIALGGLISTVIIVSVVLVERRRMPPPAYPNATLYPPGVDGRASGPDPSPPPPPAPDEDPLDHLW